MTAARRSPPKFPLRLDRLGGGATGGAGASRALLRPQAPLRHAATDALQQVVPSGVGLDSAAVRLRMVARLQAGGLRNEALLEALASVPRHLFVDSALVNQAYEDTSLPIGHEQTISKPSVVARMIDLLMQGHSAGDSGTLGRVLEIGSGCGYQAAVLAQLARQVVSLERVRGLHDKARVTLSQLRETRVRLLYGDGMLGHPGGAPYDSIIAAAGGDTVPQAWLDQLALGGRLVAPVRADSRQQALVVVDRTDNGWRRSVHDSVYFVPLKAGLDR